LFLLSYELLGAKWEYLVDVLYRLSDWNPAKDSLESLLPDRWVKSPTPPTEAAALVAAKGQETPVKQEFQATTP
jgi:hypothetical protein